MTKKYKASSIVHLVVTLSDGSRKRISFSAQTGGGSTYVTSDAAIQSALERHSYCGKLFFPVKSAALPQRTAIPRPAVAAAKKAAAAPKVRRLEMSSLGDAKDYLAEHYGLSRTKLRSKTAILAAGKEHGIEFVF